MNENLDLTKILDGCPPGTEFYHLIYGQVALREVIKDEYPIVLEPINKFIRTTLTKDGRMNNRYDGECLLYPSKTQRDWSKFERFWDESEVERFDPKTLQPFDKVCIVCSEHGDFWQMPNNHLHGAKCPQCAQIEKCRKMKKKWI